MIPLIIAGLTTFIALAGGVQFYRCPELGAFFVLLGLAAVVWAGYVWVKDKKRPDIIPPLALLLGPMVISIAANPHILPAGANRILLFIIALAVLILAARQNPADMQAGLWWAGLIWPVAWWVTGRDSPNIAAVWSVVFALVGLRSGAVWYTAIHLVMLGLFGSRGAVVGFMVGMWILNPPRTHRGATLAVLALCLAALIIYRPVTALYRLDYWRSAVTAWLQSPWFGVGPGGINALQLIPEPGGGYQIHAHNIFISWLTETGLLGLVTLAAAAWHIWISGFRVSRWQGAILAALLAHSMVDEPLWWPGPLLLAAAVIGARENVWIYTPIGWKQSQPEINTI